MSFFSGDHDRGFIWRHRCSFVIAAVLQKPRCCCPSTAFHFRVFYLARKHPPLNVPRPLTVFFCVKTSLESIQTLNWLAPPLPKETGIPAPGFDLSVDLLGRQHSSAAGAPCRLTITHATVCMRPSICRQIRLTENFGIWHATRATKAHWHEQILEAHLNPRAPRHVNNVVAQEFSRSKAIP